MPDIVVTTPLQEMANSAREAADCIANGGGEYFRRFGAQRPHIKAGDRVYYVENGYIRGFAVVKYTGDSEKRSCDSTDRSYEAGFYVFMDATSWQWILPVPMKGFQNWRYAKFKREQVEIVGDWLAPYPEVM